MDRILNNKINTREKEYKNEINEFMNELQKALDKTKNNVYINEDLYKELYKELDLTPRNKRQLKKVIGECLIEESYKTPFLYVSYNKKLDEYYLDLYNKGITRQIVNKEDLEDLKVGSFYYPINNFEKIAEDESLRDYIKEETKFRMEYFELNDRKRKK